MRARWLHLLLVGVFLVGISPTAVPHPMADSLLSANIALSERRLIEALDLLEEAMDFEPALQGLLLQAAPIALAADEPDRALGYLDTASAVDPTGQDQTCLRSRVYLSLGEISNASHSWELYPEVCPDAGRFLRDLSSAYLAQNDLQAARPILEKLANLEPGDADNHLKLGILLATTQPDEAPIHLRLANEHSSGGSPLALSLIRAIEDSRPTEDASYTLAQIGQALAKHGEWESAIWAFEGALAIKPEYIEARAYLGLSLDNANQNGFTELQAATAAAPNATLPHIFLAHHWQARAQPARALEELEIASRLEPGNPAIAADLGAVHAALGDIQTAESYFRLSTSLAPNDARFWLLLAQFSLSHEIEIHTLGVRAARNAAVLNPNDPIAVDALGYAHLLMGNFLLAERLLHQAIDLQPVRAETQLHLGILRQLQGDFARAQSSLQMAAQLDPEGPVGKLAVRALENITP